MEITIIAYIVQVVAIALALQKWTSIENKKLRFFVKLFFSVLGLASFVYECCSIEIPIVLVIEAEALAAGIMIGVFFRKGYKHWYEIIDKDNSIKSLFPCLWRSWMGHIAMMIIFIVFIASYVLFAVKLQTVIAAFFCAAWVLLVLYIIMLIAVLFSYLMYKGVKLGVEWLHN